MSFVWKRGHTVAAVVVGLVLVGGGVGAATVLAGRAQVPVATGSDSSVPTAGASSTPTAGPTTTPKPTDPLTGGKVSAHGVIAVKVENIAAARPQVGLHQADIVFAEEVEGAQTRLIAIYHSTYPTRLGPVRSARSTDVQLLPLFGRPGLVYSGANSRVQHKIDKASIVPIYRETRDNRRPAPHNVFVNLAKLAEQEKVGEAQSIGWTFAADPAQQGAKASSAKAKVGHDVFTFAYRDGRYTVRWNGRTYVDGDSGTVTKTDNVVIMNVHNHADGNRDVLGSPSVQSDTVGKGKVTVYRDGVKITGTWRRSKASGPLELIDSSGAPIALKPGHTWVALRG
jgi:hypothetical protein